MEPSKGKISYKVETKRGWRIILMQNKHDILHGYMREQAEANAQRIALCYNTHEGLVGALKKIATDCPTQTISEFACKLQRIAEQALKQAQAE